MIPSIIHYCCLEGVHCLPLHCVAFASWKNGCPIVRFTKWNEQNFDVNAHPYTREAYAAGKFAYVSDFARYKILEEHGGMYFDTDVEVIASLEDLLEKGAFMGIEQGTPISVNPGLGAGCPPQHPFFKEMCRYFDSLPFTILKANQLQDLLYQARQNTFYNTDLNAKTVTKKLLACLFTLQTTSTQWTMLREKSSSA